MAKTELTDQAVCNTVGALFRNSQMGTAEQIVAERVIRYILRSFRDVMPSGQFLPFLHHLETSYPTFDIFIPDSRIARNYGEDFFAPYPDFPIYDTWLPRSKQGSDRLGKLIGRIRNEGIIAFAQSMASGLPYWLVTRQTLAGNISIGNKLNIYDLCGAPGNKTLNFIHSSNVSEVTAVINDHKPHRLKRVEERLTNEFDFVPKKGGFNRKLKDGREVTIYLDFADASNQDEVRRSADRFFKEGKADIVIADVDCPGDGRITTDMRRLLASSGTDRGWPSFAVQFYPRSIKDVISQARILKSAILIARETGVVSYSTCSVNPFVNEGVVSVVLEEVKGLKVLDLPVDEKYLFPSLHEFHEEKFEPQAKGTRSYPHTFGEGFFCSLLQTT